MKTLILITSLLVLGLMGVGCSKSNSQADANPNNVTAVTPAITIDPIVNSNPYAYSVSGGSTSTFIPVSAAVMNEYVATHPLNAPTNFQVSVNLTQSTAGRYGGEVTISYVDNGIQYAGVFKAGIGSNAVLKGLYDNGRPEADYNYWFKFENQTVFTGFFEDEYGAVTISLTPETPVTTSTNDAEPITTTKYKGSIYFKNFVTSFAPHSPYRSCWYIYNGPYDCRSNVIQTKCGLNPGTEAGYKLLGTFSNVDIKAAFNIQ